jgi:hypothetical protein
VLERRGDLPARAEPLHDRGAESIEQVVQIDLLVALFGQHLVHGRDREDAVHGMLERLAGVDALGA